MNPKKTSYAQENPSPAITLSSPASCAASIPYLLGFYPQGSAVFLCVKDGALLATARLDLPDLIDDVSEVADQIAQRVADSGATHAIVAVFPHDDDIPQGPLYFTRDPREPFEDFVDIICEALSFEGVITLDCLLVERDQWWSFFCSDDCCLTGHDFDTPDAQNSVDHFTQSGRVVAENREVLEHELDFQPSWIADEVRNGQWESSIFSTDSDARDLREAWRDTALETFRNLIEHSRLGGLDMGESYIPQLIVSLHDIRVRDTLVWRVLKSGRWTSAHRLFVRLSCATPPGFRAPVTCLAGLFAWQMGDGARARCGVNEALLDDPDYSFAHLLVAGLDSGMPPNRWREALLALDEGTCRHG